MFGDPLGKVTMFALPMTGLAGAFFGELGVANGTKDQQTS